MTENEARRYIGELFRIVSTTSILVIDSRGALHRLNCPFLVLSIMDVPPDIINGMRYRVEAVRMSLDLKDIFIIQDKGYYIWGFIILLE
jgi:hypothetical protein